MKTTNKFLSGIVVFSTLFITSCATHVEKQVYERDLSNNLTAICIDAINDIIGGRNAKEVSGVLRFPKDFENVKDAQIQYGFESEYLAEEAQELFKSYMPIMYDDKERWLKLTDKGRLNYVLKNEANIFPYRAKGALVKIVEDESLRNALPESFIYDSGNFEIVLDPVNTAEELVSKIKLINEKFGIGSMQTTISNPINKTLLKKNADYVKAMKDETFGYYNFVNDMDTLNKLLSGYARYEKDPTIESAKSFAHPWLGPMTKMKRDKLELLIGEIFDLNKLSAQRLKEMSMLVNSHKFTGGLTFRPDVAYKKGRVASEVRDCHQNVKCLEDRIIRETYFLMKGKKEFSNFKNLIAFDSIGDYKKMPLKVRKMLENLFPIYGHYTEVELQLYRNFSYPLRDWSKHVELLGEPELRNQIAVAQEKYLATLTEMAQNGYDEEQGRIKIMGALTEFSKTSGLAEAMNKKFKTMIDDVEIEKLKDLKLTLYLQNYYYMTRLNLSPEKLLELRYA